MKYVLMLAALLGSVSTHAFPWFASGENIRGANLMTPEERQTYVSRLQGMPSKEQCQAFMQAHHLELDRRAKEKNIQLPPVSGDPCKVMQSMGRFR